MEIISFKLMGKTGFFKKPDVNSFAYFTYNNIHKVALLGLLGAIVGLKGYHQQKKLLEEKKEAIYPEFYEKLKGLKVAIIPLSQNGYFSKKIQVFNNSIGYASKEQGGNLIVKEQWLENPAWKIYLLNDGCVEDDIYDTLKQYLLDAKCKFIPYLGKNDHLAVIDNCEIVELEKICNPIYISSLFPLGKVDLDQEETYDDKLPYIFKEVVPIGLNREYNFYEYIELGFTNLEIENLNGLEELYKDNDKVLAFI